MRRTWLVVGAIWLAIFILRIYFLPAPDPELVAQVEHKVTFSGLITDEPDYRDTSTLLTVQPGNAVAKVLITAPPYGNYAYGDELKVTGTLKLPENFATENGAEFNYQKYLEKDGIFFVMSRPGLTVTAHQQGNPILEFLFKIKLGLVGKFNQLLPEPESSLLAGLVIGEKQGLGEEWNNRFRTAGLSHIVVLSGYNLSIVAENLLRLVGWFLPRTVSLATGAVGIIIFAAMVGGGATVLRASLMALIALLARATGRAYQATIALVAAGALMLLFNPLLLLYDLGFQLSFLATFGVIHGPPLLAPYFRRVPEKFWGLAIREIILTTISAQIIVLPLILYSTGNFSLVALPANLLVLSFIPITMLAGFLSALIGFISPLLAWPITLLAHLLLAYILLVVKIVSSLPFAAVILPPFPLVLMFILYGGLFYLVKKMRKYGLV